MKNRLGQVDVTKVAGALRCVAGTGLATGGAVYGALSRIHQTAQLGPPALESFRISKTETP